MGRISTLKVKRIGNELLEQYNDEFSEDFDKNKESIDNLVITPSKKLRNTITGYVTRQKKKARIGKRPIKPKPVQRFGRRRN